MGKTVPSYRVALEDEMLSWRKFAEALNTQDQDAFEVLMDASRNKLHGSRQRRQTSRLRGHGHVDNALSTETDRQTREGTRLFENRRNSP